MKEIKLFFYLFSQKTYEEESYRAGWVKKQDTMSGTFNLLSLVFLRNTLLILGLSLLFTLWIFFQFLPQTAVNHNKRVTTSSYCIQEIYNNSHLKYFHLIWSSKMPVHLGGTERGCILNLMLNGLFFTVQKGNSCHLNTNYMVADKKGACAGCWT